MDDDQQQDYQWYQIQLEERAQMELEAKLLSAKPCRPLTEEEEYAFKAERTAF